MPAAVEIVGYVGTVKAGVPEICNCHSEDSSDYDTHIEICLAPPGNGKEGRMIVEVIPSWLW